MQGETEFFGDDRPVDDRGPRHIKDVLAELLAEMEIVAGEEPLVAA